MSDLSSNRPIRQATRARTVPDLSYRTPPPTTTTTQQQRKRHVRWSRVLTSDVPSEPRHLTSSPKSVLKRDTTTTSTYFNKPSSSAKRHRYISTKANYREQWHANALRVCEIYIRKLPDAVDVFSSKILKCAGNLQRYGYIWDAIELRGKLETALTETKNDVVEENDFSVAFPEFDMLPIEDEETKTESFEREDEVVSDKDDKEKEIVSFREENDTHTENISLSFKDFSFESLESPREAHVEEKTEETATLMEIFEESSLTEEPASPVPTIGVSASLSERSQNYEPEDVERIVVNVRVMGESGDSMIVDVCDASLRRDDDGMSTDSDDDAIEMMDVELHVLSESDSGDGVIMVDVCVAGERLQNDDDDDDGVVEVDEKKKEDDEEIKRIVAEYLSDMIDFLEHDIRWKARMKLEEEERRLVEESREVEMVENDLVVETPEGEIVENDLVMESPGVEMLENDERDLVMVSPEVEMVENDERDLVMESPEVEMVENDERDLVMESPEVEMMENDENDLIVESPDIEMKRSEDILVVEIAGDDASNLQGDDENVTTSTESPPRDLRRQRLCSLQRLKLSTSKLPPAPSNEIWTSFDLACAQREVHDDVPVCSLQSLSSLPLATEQKDEEEEVNVDLVVPPSVIRRVF